MHIISKEELSTIVINELATFGVKYHRPKDKKIKVTFQTSRSNRVFRSHLHLLELKEVVLADGSSVQIPKFLAEAIDVILQKGFEVEGIFRRGGSVSKQKELRRQLEAGLPIYSEPNILNIADLVKAFFRELAEPLIPPLLQETLLQCARLRDGNVRACLLACLLLPQLNINTLAYYMQFLNTVSQSASKNHMTASNLAIVIMPGLFTSIDLTNHACVNVVQLLIEHSHALAMIPESVACMLRVNHDFEMAGTPTKTAEKDKKKKKRPSDLFHGLKKIYASTGSSENLVNTPDAHKTPASANALALIQKEEQQQQQQQQRLQALATPCLKTNNKKRQFAEPVCAFSAKKKRDLLALLPSNRGGPVPNTPLTKEVKKSRLSLGGNGHLKSVCANPVISSMERRWSSVGSNSSKAKVKYLKSQDDSAKTPIALASVTNDINSEAACGSVPSGGSSNQPVETTQSSDSDAFVRIPKNEYEALKQRAAALESLKTQAWRPRLPASTTSTAAPQSEAAARVSTAAPAMSGPQLVQTKYEQMMVETEMLCSPGTDHLAKRLSRNLRIRRSTDQRVMRSPSARKIGTIRRRSQEKVRLSRNPTWHISSTSLNRAQPPARQSQEAPATSAPQSSSTFYTKSNLKRGRPNTLNTGLLPQALSSQPIAEQTFTVETPRKGRSAGESWTAGELFFSHLSYAAVAKTERTGCDENVPEPSTPLHVTLREPNAKDKDNMPTPMLPPRSVPRKPHSLRTPNTAMKRPTAATASAFATRLAMATPIAEEENRRESIARLRTQNAGMVMAKAKLFDDLGGHDAEPPAPASTANATKAARAVVSKGAPPPTAQSGAVRAKVVVGRGDNERSCSSSKKRPLAERALIRNHKNAMAAAPSPRRPCRPAVAQMAAYRSSPRFVRTKSAKNH